MTDVRCKRCSAKLRWNPFEKAWLLDSAPLRLGQVWAYRTCIQGEVHAPLIQAERQVQA
jgi:hypothetical protein